MTREMGAARTMRSASRTSFNVEAWSMAPRIGGFFEYIRGVYAGDHPTFFAGGESYRAPDQADPDYPERACHGLTGRPYGLYGLYDPVILLRVADRDPAPSGVSESRAFSHEDAGALEIFGLEPDHNEVAL